MSDVHMDQEERVLDQEEWHVEAQGVIKDIHSFVDEIVIANGPGSSDQHIYLNLTTKEKNKYCIELTAQGFHIVGYDYNQTDKPQNSYYETPYALLDKLSPLYREAFGNSLASKLQELHSRQNGGEEL